MSLKRDRLHHSWRYPIHRPTPGGQVESAAKLLLRVFVETDDVAQAQHLLEGEIVPTLARHARIGDREIERYWKIPHWFELTLRLQPLGDAREAYQRVVGLARDGWTSSDDAPGGDTVWNPTADSTFLAPEVRWAHLQLWFEEPTPG